MSRRRRATPHGKPSRPPEGRTAIWWIRRDLRLHDNPALTAAAASGGAVVPVFVLDPVLLEAPTTSPGRLAFLSAGLHALDADLRRRGGRLVVRRGRPAEVLRALAEETHAATIVAERDVSPYARRRDADVADGLPLQLVEGVTVLPVGSVRTSAGTGYRVFGAFRRAWLEAWNASHLHPLLPPRRVATPDGVRSERIPTPTTRAPDFPPGEAAARRRLQAFARGAHAPVYRYVADRDRVDRDATSRLSPYLRFGMVSAQAAAAAARAAVAAAPHAAARRSAEAWFVELIWREFYLNVLHFFPEVLTRAFRPALRHIRWENTVELFRAWGEGRTGFPIVDAAMRQLTQTGWLHNRARMIVASFLVKDLLVDWRWGERYLMRHLLDGDPAANNGGWQWTAGVGTDAAPYFRIFNPTAQGRRVDPRGDFVRRWLPALARVPRTFVHAPWQMSREAQRAARCIIGVDYPAPIVDHAAAREAALRRYTEARRRFANSAGPPEGPGA